MLNSFQLIESSCDEVLIATQGSLGVIILNRPKALNATNYLMLNAINEALDRFETSSLIKHVAILSSSSGFFCAGGDIRAAYEAIKEKDFKSCELFFKTEYALNYRLSTFSKPLYAFVSGYNLGGGMGISMHCTYRIADDSALFGMPETLIGFFPDVGAAYFLNLIPLEEGLYWGLTGEFLNAQNAYSTGLATHLISQNQWPHLLNQLKNNEPLEALDFQKMILKNTISQEILDAFKSDDLISCMNSLKNNLGTHNLHGFFKYKSPLSLHVTYAYFKKCRHLSLKDVLQHDFNLAMKFVRHSDFCEGVRAQLIDKDKNPKWTYASLEEVPLSIVSEFLKFD